MRETLAATEDELKQLRVKVEEATPTARKSKWIWCASRPS
jgi:hypothetical protein